MRIIIDLDGVICQSKTSLEQSYYDLPPTEGAPEVIQDLKNKGHHIIIHTARGMKTCFGSVKDVYEMHYENIVNWLNRWNIPFDELILGKPYGDVYIDDLAISHKNWGKTRRELKERLSNESNTGTNR